MDTLQGRMSGRLEGSQRPTRTEARLGFSLGRPSSDRAYDLGCTCPKDANNSGLYLEHGTDWVLSLNCPIHIAKTGVDNA